MLDTPEPKSSSLAAHVAAYGDAIAAALHDAGWVVLPEFLRAPHRNELLADCQRRRDEFAEAAVGRGAARQSSIEQRRDTTLWLRENEGVQRDFLMAMDTLRGAINRRLYLGLHDYEAHYAHYAPGAFYRRHRDAFARAHTAANQPQRILTSVIYLNDCAGGELLLWSDEHELARIAPVAGTAVFFLSAEFPHEVLPAASDRYSIAGWFRGR